MGKNTQQQTPHVSLPPQPKPQEPGQFAPSAYTSRKQTPMPKAKAEPEPEQADNPSARYEYALRLAAQYAPADTPMEQVTRSFAETLPPEECADLLAWWQRQQQEQAEDAWPAVQTQGGRKVHDGTSRRQARPRHEV